MCKTIRIILPLLLLGILACSSESEDKDTTPDSGNVGTNEQVPSDTNPVPQTGSDTVMDTNKDTVPAGSDSSSTLSPDMSSDTQTGQETDATTDTSGTPPTDSNSDNDNPNDTSNESDTDTNSTASTDSETSSDTDTEDGGLETDTECPDLRQLGPDYYYQGSQTCPAIPITLGTACAPEHECHFCTWEHEINCLAYIQCVGGEWIDAGHDDCAEDAGQGQETDTDGSCPSDAKCCHTSETLSTSEINCNDGTAPIESCMAQCGPGVSWSTGFTCPTGTVCKSMDCYDTDGADGYCYPVNALSCNTADDCECLPTLCTISEKQTDTVAWTCENSLCTPRYI